MQFDDDVVTVDEKIQEIFGELGSPDMQTLGRECLRREIWGEDQTAGAVVAWAAKRAKDACSQVDAKGLPFAMPCEKGEHPSWKQPALFTVEEANFCIRNRVGAIRGKYTSLVVIHQFFVGRYGDEIESIPDLV